MAIACGFPARCAELFSRFVRITVSLGRLTSRLFVRSSLASCTYIQIRLREITSPWNAFVMPDPFESNDESIMNFYWKMCSGEPLGLEELWKRNFPRMYGLASKTLKGRRLTSTGPEDIVQSAFGTFWRRAKRGDFNAWINSDNLWNLLAKITVRKVHQAARRAQAGKHGGGKVLIEADVPEAAHRPFRLDDAVAVLPTTELDLCCEEYLLTIDEETRSVVVLKMMGHKNREVADILGCCVSTVERKLRLARKSWESNDFSGLTGNG